MGLESAGKLRSNPRDPLYRPSPIKVSINNKYVLHVAIIQRPSAVTSTPMMGSPKAGRAVYVVAVDAKSASRSSRLSVQADLRILADRIEQPDVTLVTSDGDASGLRGGRSRKVVFSGVLLELRFY
jgi:hypothetical protein